MKPNQDNTAYKPALNAPEYTEEILWHRVILFAVAVVLALALVIWGVSKLSQTSAPESSPLPSALTESDTSTPVEVTGAIERSVDDAESISSKVDLSENALAQLDDKMEAKVEESVAALKATQPSEAITESVENAQDKMADLGEAVESATDDTLTALDELASPEDGLSSSSDLDDGTGTATAELATATQTAANLAAIDRNLNSNSDSITDSATTTAETGAQASGTIDRSSATVDEVAASFSSADYQIFTENLNRDVARARLTDQMQGLEPADPLASTDDLTEEFFKLYFFTDLKNRAGDVITYQWALNGRTVANVEVSVNSNSWRSYSSKNITRSMRGDWEVTVLDKSGEVLARSEFKVPEAEGIALLPTEE